MKTFNKTYSNDERKIAEIIYRWGKSGFDLHHDPKLRELGLPQHPELVYRLDHKWTSWNDFLKTSPEEKKNYEMNLEEDRIQEIAFSRIRHLFFQFENSTIQ